MQNAVPAFTKSGIISSIRVTTANVKSDGAGTIGTDLFLLVTAGTEGTFIDYIRVVPVSSVAATSTTATVIRFFVCDIGSGTPTSANCYCVGEVASPVQVAASTTVPVTTIDFPCGFRLPAGKFLLASTHIVNVANTGYAVTAFGGDY